MHARALGPCLVWGFDVRMAASCQDMYIAGHVDISVVEKGSCGQPRRGLVLGPCMGAFFRFPLISGCQKQFKRKECLGCSPLRPAFFSHHYNVSVARNFGPSWGFGLSSPSAASLHSCTVQGALGLPRRLPVLSYTLPVVNTRHWFFMRIACSGVRPLLELWPSFSRVLFLSSTMNCRISRFVADEGMLYHCGLATGQALALAPASFYLPVNVGYVQDYLLFRNSV